MVAVAVRLAHMLNLHRDGQGLQYTPFEAEIRRRLWWQIVLLDMRVSEDWGSDFMIPEGSYNTCVPTNINDSDMERSATSTYLDRKGITQMTFGLIFSEASKLVKLFQVPLDEQKTRNLQERLDIVYRYQKELNEKLLSTLQLRCSNFLGHTYDRQTYYLQGMANGLLSHVHLKTGLQRIPRSGERI
jgi:hypothetical protein